MGVTNHAVFISSSFKLFQNALANTSTYIRIRQFVSLIHYPYDKYTSMERPVGG